MKQTITPPLGERNGATKVALGATAAVTTGIAAYHLVMSVAGRWFAHKQLIYSLSITVPEWDEWNAHGARTEFFTAGGLISWGVTIGWATTLWLAGTSQDKAVRSLLLLASLFGAIASIGAGDINMATTAAAANASAWLALRLFERKSSMETPAPSRAHLTLKPVWTACALAGTAIGGTLLVWNASFAPPPGTWRIDALGFCISMGLAALPVGMILRSSNLPAVAKGAGIAAILSAAWYTGPTSRSHTEFWRMSGREILRLTEPEHIRQLRSELAGYRPTEGEAAARRVGRPEAGTDWRNLSHLIGLANSAGESGRIIALWLKLDALAYGEKSAGCVWSPGFAGAIRENDWYTIPAASPRPPLLKSDQATLLTGAPLSRLQLIQELRTKGKLSPEARGWTQEAEAAVWLQLGAPDTAAQLYRRALETEPKNIAGWQGLGLAEAACGRDEAAMVAFATRALLDPRTIFSTEWTRPPLMRLRACVAARWRSEAEAVLASGRLSRDDEAKLNRFLGWQGAWSRAGGNVRKFLEDTEAPTPVFGSVKCVRERMLEMIKDPTDAKIGALFSSGVALLTDRHVNLGQCHCLYATLAGEPALQADPGVRRLISRPPMAGWDKLCRFNEGGAGASPLDFEEDLVVRLVTYGWDDSPVDIPESFLRNALKH